MDDVTSEPYPDDRYLRVTQEVTIPRSELDFRTSRSGGPGGQHVNKVETRVELLFDVGESPSLSDDQRAILLAGLTPWLDSTGVLHIVSDSYRSQYRNREDVVARFVMLLQHALRPKTPRKATRVPRGAREERLQTKRHRSSVKRLRNKRASDD